MTSRTRFRYVVLLVVISAIDQPLRLSKQNISVQRNVIKSVNVVLLIKLNDLLTFPLPSLSWY